MAVTATVIAGVAMMQVEDHAAIAVVSNILVLLQSPSTADNAVRLPLEPSQLCFGMLF